MRLEQIMAWPPVAVARLGRADDKPRKFKAPADARGLATGEVYAVDPTGQRLQDESPPEQHTVDVKV